MRYGWMAIVVMAAMVVSATSQVDAQSNSGAPRLKFTPPRSTSSAEPRPLASPAPVSSAPTSGTSSLQFRNARPASNWTESAAPAPQQQPGPYLAPPDLADETQTAEVAPPLAAPAPRSKSAPAKRAAPQPLPAEVMEAEEEEFVEEEEPAVTMQFAPPQKTAKRTSTVNRDPRVMPTAARSPYGRPAQVKRTQAQVELPAEEGPRLTPQPDPISTEDWIQPDYNDEPWIGGNPGSGNAGPNYFGPGKYRERFWFRGDYIAGWTNGMSLPPLVTTSPDGTPRNIPFAIANVDANQNVANPQVAGFKRVPIAGVLGYPNTTVLFGNQRVNNRYRPGGQFTFGMWLTPSRMLGIEGDYLALADQGTRFRAAGTNGSPIIMRPFFNTDVNVNLPDVEVVNVPPSNRPGLEGQVTIDTLSRFQTAGIRFLVNWGCDDGCPDFADFCGRPVWVDCNLLLGYRWARLDEGVWIQENLRVFADGTDNDAQGFVGTTINVFDSFRTQNQFHGADLGTLTKVTHGRWTYELLSKIALGNTQSIQTIEGLTVVTPVPPGAVVQTADTGLLAQRSNVGRHTSNKFSTIPETKLTLGYQLTPRLRVHAGYSFLVWTNVLRGGDQIDPYVNGQYLNGAANIQGLNRPLYTPNYGHLYVHAINTGIEARF